MINRELKKETYILLGRYISDLNGLCKKNNRSYKYKPVKNKETGIGQVIREWSDKSRDIIGTEHNLFKIFQILEWEIEIEERYEVK